MIQDPFDLSRFVTAQAGVYEVALAELEAGQKRSHWMWFIFPQLRGLGHSSTAYRYGITSLGEARAYLAHPLLGARLERCTGSALASPARTPHDLFGSPDDLKFHASMTLFARASDTRDSLYGRALESLYAGRVHPQSVNLLAAWT